MPIYDMACPKCGRRNDIFAHVDERVKPCPDCGSEMTRLFSPRFNVNPDYAPWMDENMGHEPVYVRGRRHQKELLRRKGLVQVG